MEIFIVSSGNCRENLVAFSNVQAATAYNKVEKFEVKDTYVPAKANNADRESSRHIAALYLCTKKWSIGNDVVCKKGLRYLVKEAIPKNGETEEDVSGYYDLVGEDNKVYETTWLGVGEHFDTSRAIVMESNGWVNHGDLNFFVNGGYLTRKDEKIDGVYEVFDLSTEAGYSGDEYDAVWYRVDIGDVTKENLKDILYLCGLENSEKVVGKTREEIIAALGEDKVAIEAATSIGVYRDRTFKSGSLSEAELKAWLRELGAGDFAPKD